MPVFLDRRALLGRARTLLRSARISPWKITLLLIGIELALTLLLGWFVPMPSLEDVLYYGISEISSAALFLQILCNLIYVLLDIGYAGYILGIGRGEEMPLLSLFDAFAFAGKAIRLALLQTLLITLWSMLFLIPGVIAAYRYSMAVFCLCDDPEIGVFEALARSRRLTQGNKLSLFLLTLCFLPYLLIPIGAVALTSFVMMIPSSIDLYFYASLALYTALVVTEVLAFRLFFQPYFTLATALAYEQLCQAAEPPEETGESF